MNKKFLAITITLFAVFGFLLVGEVEAGQEHNVSGWAWSENIGWISFNCTNQGTCGTANYGVNINSDGTFSGYAWSEHIGWITFNESELTNCPIAPCQAKLDLSTKQISGWAKALTDGGGWDGWIRLRDTNYGVWIDTNVSPAEFRNWAWSDMVIGWISFNCSNQGVCGTSNYKVITSFSFNNPPNAAMSCQIVDCKGPGCECNGAWTTFNGDGVIYRINNDSTDPDDNIVKSTWSIVGWQDPYFSCSSPNPLCNLTLPKIPAGNYSIKLKVEDAGGLSDETFHAIKVKQDAIADFDCSLDGEDWATACENLIVNQGQLIYLKDKSTPSEGASIISRTWKINNVVFDSDNNSTTSVNLVESENTITLVIGDSQGRSDSEDKTIEARLPLPEYKEVPPTIWLKKFFAVIVNFFDGFLKI